MMENRPACPPGESSSQRLVRGTHPRTFESRIASMDLDSTSDLIDSMRAKINSDICK